MTLPADPLIWAVKAFRDERAARYALYRRYLDGDHNLEYATQKFRQAFGRLFEAFSYNRCGTVVDAHADRVRVAGFGADDDSAGDDPIAQAAQDLWDAAGMDIHEGQLNVESFAMGDAYLIVSVLPDGPDQGTVQFWPQRADQIRVHYDDERPGVIDLAAKMWRGDDERMYLNLYFTDRIEKYRTATKAHSVPTSARAFEPYQPDTDTAWPVRLAVTDTVPVFAFHNNGRVNEYGTSELRDVIALQDAINKSLMDQLVASEFAAAPQRAILGYDASDPDSKAALEGLVAGVTRLLAIPADADGNVPSLAEFSAADMKQYDLIAEKWDIRISRVSRVPVHYLTGETTAESGRAKRLNEAPFVAKIEDRQKERAPQYADAVTYGLRLQGVAVDPGDLRVNFVSAAPMSEEDMWDMAAAKAQTGMPLAVVLRELGYEPDQIDDIMQKVREERDAAMLDLGTFQGPTQDGEDQGAA